MYVISLLLLLLVLVSIPLELGKIVQSGLCVLRDNVGNIRIRTVSESGLFVFRGNFGILKRHKECGNYVVSVRDNIVSIMIWG